MSKTRVRLYLRHPLRMFAYDRMSYWHEAASLGLATLPRWHPALDRSTLRYLTWRARWKRWGGGMK